MLKGYNPYLSNKTSWQIIFAFFTQIYTKILIWMCDIVHDIDNVHLRIE